MRDYRETLSDIRKGLPTDYNEGVEKLTQSFQNYLETSQALVDQPGFESYRHLRLNFATVKFRIGYIMDRRNKRRDRAAAFNESVIDLRTDIDALLAGLQTTR